MIQPKITRDDGSLTINSFCDSFNRHDSANLTNKSKEPEAHHNDRIFFRIERLFKETTAIINVTCSADKKVTKERDNLCGTPRGENISDIYLTRDSFDSIHLYNNNNGRVKTKKQMLNACKGKRTRRPQNSYIDNFIYCSKLFLKSNTTTCGILSGRKKENEASNILEGSKNIKNGTLYCINDVFYQFGCRTETHQANNKCSINLILHELSDTLNSLVDESRKFFTK